jgi:hypothetical protein
MFLREFLVLEANKLSIIFISMGLMPVPTLMKQPLGDIPDDFKFINFSGLSK